MDFLIEDPTQASFSSIYLFFFFFREQKMLSKFNKLTACYTNRFG